MIEQLQKKDFISHIAEAFIIHINDSVSKSIILVDLIDRSAGNREDFSLLFHGMADLVFRHDTYLISHPVIGDFSLFIGPVDSNEPNDVICYEAVFNRIINTIEEVKKYE